MGSRRGKNHIERLGNAFATKRILSEDFIVKGEPDYSNYYEENPQIHIGDLQRQKHVGELLIVREKVLLRTLDKENHSECQPQQEEAVQLRE